MRRTKAALGTTLNDVVLAATAGALRHYLARHGELAWDLLAMVPVSVRRPEEETSLGNRVNSMYVDLPVTEADARTRLRLVMESVSRSKNHFNTPGSRTIGAAAEYGPPAVMRHLRERRLRGSFFNLAVTNTGGIDRPLHCCGRRLELSFTTAPPTPYHGLAIGVFSYLDTFAFSVTADRDRVPDSRLIAADLRTSLDELYALVHHREPARAAPDQLFAESGADFDSA